MRGRREQQPLALTSGDPEWGRPSEMGVLAHLLRESASGHPKAQPGVRGALHCDSVCVHARVRPPKCLPQGARGGGELAEGAASIHAASVR